MSAPLPAAAAVAALFCSQCDAPFTAAVAEAYPLSLCCGHTVCSACADAMAIMSPPQCLLCKSDVHEAPTPNTGFAVFADAVAAAQGKDDEGRTAGPALSAGVGVSGPPSAPSTCAVHAGTVCTVLCLTHGRGLCSGCDMAAHSSCVTAPIDSGLISSHVATSTLATLVDHCRVSCERTIEGSAALQAARNRLITRKAVSLMELHACAAELKAVIDEHVASRVADVESRAKAALKALDAQLTALSVTVGQFECVAAMARFFMAPVDATAASLLPRDSATFACVFESVARTAALGIPYKGPVVPTNVGVAVPPKAFADLKASLAEFSRIIGSTSLDRRSIRGSGQYGFTAGKEMTITVHVDADLPVEDVTVWATNAPDLPNARQIGGVNSPAHGSGGDASMSRHPASSSATSVLSTVTPEAPCTAWNLREITRVDNGVYTIMYVVDDEAAALQIGINIAGQSYVTRRITCRPPGCSASGMHLQTIPVALSEKFGLAVSADGQWLAVSDRSDKCELNLYSLPGGEFVRRLSSARGSKRGQCDRPFRACFTPGGNVLVAEYVNNRVQEFTVSGESVREFQVQEAWSVACNDEVVVIGSLRSGTGVVEVFDYGSGAKMRAIVKYGSAVGEVDYPEGIRISPDGTMLLIAEDSGRITRFTLEGVFVDVLGVGVLGRGRKDVEYGMPGEIVVADFDHHRIVVFSEADGSVLRTFGSHGDRDGQFASPTALAVHGSQLYVLDKESARVQVFE